MTHLRCLVLSLVSAAIYAESSQPLPSLPPEPRALQIENPVTPGLGAGPSELDRDRVGKDLEALKRAVQRVRQAAESKLERSPDSSLEEEADLDAAQSEVERKPSGKPLMSSRLNMTVQRYSDGSAEVTAAVKRERLELVYRELAMLIDHPIDDSQLISSQSLVSLHVDAVAWREALDRLLGQEGLAWREEGSGKKAKIVLFDLGTQQHASEKRAQMAQEALLQAAVDHNTPYGAEALYQMARQEMAAHRYLDAIRIFSNVVEEFYTRADFATHQWVLRSIRGIGDAMMELEQFQDARSVYLNYVSKADPNDRQLPEVYLRAAQASRRLGDREHDPSAYDDAIDLLHTMLDKYAGQQQALKEVSVARLTLGELLNNAGRFSEAETQLKLFTDAVRQIDDQVSFWLAECAFQQGRYTEARPTFERLARAMLNKRADPAVPVSVYSTAAYRVGQCWLKQEDPQSAQALFAFLRAYQQYGKTDVEEEILINIARCYADLEREDRAIETLWTLLKSDALDSRPGQLQLDQLLGELEGKLTGYSGPVRARVLFYIAQANYREALRDRSERTRLVTDAIHRYERVLAEEPPADLRHAAQIGLSRAMLLAGQELDAENTLNDILRDTTLSARDREYAGQLLGNYYRTNGRLREAITAYQGEARKDEHEQAQ
jgi:tetratricopeptide (TPR) repeat protein